MQVIYNDKLTPYTTEKIKSLAKECGILFDTARLLFYRNIDSVEKAKRFLNPDKKNFISPFLLKGMSVAAERIKQAKENRERVLIFGDYDADGISATTVLFYCLKEFGINAKTIIPEREDGYGLNVEKIIAETNNNVDLIITVDCGISDAEKIERLKELNIDVIVTDHHEPPELLPDCTIINPKIQGQEYPFSGLCGAGVAYKLGSALIGAAADKYLDFVALATVSDSMDLIDENRDLVYEGLKLFSANKIRPCFKFLLSDNQKTVNAQSLAFSIAPKINAGGRMGDANLALKLFMAQNLSEISAISDKLKLLNVERQIECDNIYKEAKQLIVKYNLINDEIIMIYDEKWRTGFLGIVAAKLVEEYSRPVIVFGSHDGFLKGSSRSVDGINIYEVISSAKDLLNAFGGHAQAAGVTVEKARFSALKKRLNNYIRDNYKDLDYTKKIYAEWEVKGISPEFAHEIERLEPFGVGNRRPYFAVRECAVASLPIKTGSAHYSFNVNGFEMLDFNGEADAKILSLPIEKEIVFETNVSVFRGKEYIKGFVKAVVPDYSDFKPLKLNVLDNELEKAKAGGNARVKDFDNVFKDKTFYAVTEYETLKKFPQLSSVGATLFVPEGNIIKTCVVVSPTAVPFGYKRVVYLDKPLSSLPFDGESMCIKENGVSLFCSLDCSRDVFSAAYKEIIDKTPFDCLSALQFVEENDFNLSKEQMLFVTKVFMELGIIECINGKLKRNVNVKNPLENSTIYNAVKNLKV